MSFRLTIFQHQYFHPYLNNFISSFPLTHQPTSMPGTFSPLLLSTVIYKNATDRILCITHHHIPAPLPYSRRLLFSTLLQCSSSHCVTHLASNKLLKENQVSSSQFLLPVRICSPSIMLFLIPHTWEISFCMLIYYLVVRRNAMQCYLDISSEYHVEC